MVTKRDTRGFRDWLIQRVSAVLIAAYVIWLFVFYCMHGLYDFSAWHGLLSSPIFQVLTTVVLVAMMWHAWIGLWTVATDYIQVNVIQRLVLFVVAAILIIYLVFGIIVAWS